MVNAISIFRLEANRSKILNISISRSRWDESILRITSEQRKANSPRPFMEDLSEDIVLTEADPSTFLSNSTIATSCLGYPSRLGQLYGCLPLQRTFCKMCSFSSALSQIQTIWSKHPSNRTRASIELDISHTKYSMIIPRCHTLRSRWFNQEIWFPRRPNCNWFFWSGKLSRKAQGKYHYSNGWTLWLL